MRVFSLYYIQSAFQNLTTECATGDGENSPEYSAFLLKVPSQGPKHLQAMWPLLRPGSTAMCPAALLPY